MVVPGLIYLYLAYCVVRYLVECGSLWRTVSTTAWFAIVTGFYVILLMALNSARLDAQRLIGSNNLKQIGLAMHMYASSEGTFPPQFLSDAQGRPMHSWRVLLLPNLGDEYKAIYDAYDFKEPWDGPHNRRLADQVPAVYRSRRGPFPGGVTDYLAIVDPRAIFSGARPTRPGDITDDMSQTMVAVELKGSGINWLEPRDLSVDEVLSVLEGRKDSRLNAPFPGGINSLFADGSTTFTRLGISPETLRGLVTRDGGEAVSKEP